LTNFERQNAHSTNGNFDQLRHISNMNDVVRLGDATTEAAMWQLLHANKADPSSHCRNYAQQRYNERTLSNQHPKCCVMAFPNWCVDHCS